MWKREDPYKPLLLLLLSLWLLLLEDNTAVCAEPGLHQDWTKDPHYAEHQLMNVGVRTPHPLPLLVVLTSWWLWQCLSHSQFRSPPSAVWCVSRTFAFHENTASNCHACCFCFLQPNCSGHPRNQTIPKCPCNNTDKLPMTLTNCPHHTTLTNCPYNNIDKPSLSMNLPKWIQETNSK